MILVVSPEPSWWLASHLRHSEDARVFAPWATRMSVPRVFPRRVRAFFDRRRIEGAVPIPGWQLAEGLARWWAGTRAERKLRVRFALRDAVDRLAAAWVLRSRPSAVIAPTCSARRVFAAAHRVGAKAVLVEDMPDIRGLHRDLDRAASAHPECRFLRRYRAPSPLLARQEAERVLADEILVRGRFARDERLAAGVDPSSVGAMAEPVAEPMPVWTGSRPRVLLAGLAAARHGTVEALAALDRIPDIELAIRAGEGTEPESLLCHPRVVADDGLGANAIIAPAWCESYPSDVARASAAGIAVIATARAAGFAEVAETPVGDVAALAAQLEAAITKL